MKTLTPDQRMEGFTELEGVLGEGGVGGAHLMSFLAGVAHAEKVLGEEQMSNEWVEAEEEMAEEYAAPRKPFVRLTDEEIMDIYMKWINDNNGQPLGRAIEDALEEKNK